MVYTKTSGIFFTVYNCLEPTSRLSYLSLRQPIIWYDYLCCFRCNAMNSFLNTKTARTSTAGDPHHQSLYTNTLTHLRGETHGYQAKVRHTFSSANKQHKVMRKVVRICMLFKEYFLCRLNFEKCQRTDSTAARQQGSTAAHWCAA